MTGRKKPKISCAPKICKIFQEIPKPFYKYDNNRGNRAGCARSPVYSVYRKVQDFYRRHQGNRAELPGKLQAGKVLRRECEYRHNMRKQDRRQLQRCGLPKKPDLLLHNIAFVKPKYLYTQLLRINLWLKSNLTKEQRKKILNSAF